MNNNQDQFNRFLEDHRDEMSKAWMDAMFFGSGTIRITYENLKDGIRVEAVNTAIPYKRSIFNKVLTFIKNMF